MCFIPCDEERIAYSIPYFRPHSLIYLSATQAFHTAFLMQPRERGQHMHDNPDALIRRIYTTLY